MIFVKSSFVNLLEVVPQYAINKCKITQYENTVNVRDLNGAPSQINTSVLFTPPPPPPPYVVNNANFSTEAHTTKSAAWRVPCASVIQPYRPGSASQCNGTDHTRGVGRVCFIAEIGIAYARLKRSSSNRRPIDNHLFTILGIS